MTPKQLKNNFLRGILAGIVAVILFTQGCKKSERPSTPAPVVKAVVTATGKQPEKPVQKQVSSSLKLKAAPVNQFDFSNKVDPFKPYAVIMKSPVRAHVRSKNIDSFSLPIHSFDVSQFKLIGIIAGGKENRAMVTDPNRKGYVIKVGMTIGKNEGRIVSITSGGVDVLEQFTDDNGKTRKEHIRINLPRKQ
jgi:type IV pilus assembly protein PilP